MATLTQAAPEVAPTTYARCGPFTRSQGKAVEPGGSANVRSHAIVAPAPTHMGSAIAWRVTDEEPDLRLDAEALNTFAGRPLAARYHCLTTGCEWWAAKETSTVKHGKKAGHMVVPV